MSIRQPSIMFTLDCNDILGIHLKDISSLANVLRNAMPAELLAEIDVVHLSQTSRYIPTQPAQRKICLVCEITGKDGRKLDLPESWYLTADSFKGPFVAARAIHEPLADSHPVASTAAHLS